MIEKYVHHESEVSVDSDLKGKHRQHCLCFQCDHFKPGQKDNCSIAKQLYHLCVTFSLVTPVYECPEFEPGHPTLPAPEPAV